MANPLYGQNKFDNANDFIVGDEGEAYIKRNVISMGAETDATTLTTALTGSLVNLNGTASQIQVINLPTITTNDVGTYYDFIVTAIGNSGAAGSYTINTGGHASDSSGDSATIGYDDFHPSSTLLISAATIVATADKSTVLPSSGDGTMIIADNTSVAPIALGTNFRMTAVAESTIGTAAANVWYIEGVLFTSEATGFVTTNLFTAP